MLARENLSDLWLSEVRDTAARCCPGTEPTVAATAGGGTATEAGAAAAVGRVLSGGRVAASADVGRPVTVSSHTPPGRRRQSTADGASQMRHDRRRPRQICRATEPGLPEGQAAIGRRCRLVVAGGV